MARASHWPPEADDWLRAVPLGTPGKIVAQRYNEVALDKGWPQRTQKAIEQRWQSLVPRSRKIRSQNKPVWCPITKRRWPSIAAAAREFDRHPMTLSEALKAQGRWGPLVLCDSLEAPTKA